MRVAAILGEIMNKLRLPVVISRRQTEFLFLKNYSI